MTNSSIFSCAIIGLLSIALVHCANFKCEQEGIFGHPTNCNRFYRCVPSLRQGRFQSFAMNCGSGLSFDVADQTCKFASDVLRCAGSTSTEVVAPRKPTLKTLKSAEVPVIATSSSTFAPTSEVTSASVAVPKQRVVIRKVIFSRRPPGSSSSDRLEANRAAPVRTLHRTLSASLAYSTDDGDALDVVPVTSTAPTTTERVIRVSVNPITKSTPIPTSVRTTSVQPIWTSRPNSISHSTLATSTTIKPIKSTTNPAKRNRIAQKAVTKQQPIDSIVRSTTATIDSARSAYNFISPLATRTNQNSESTLNLGPTKRTPIIFTHELSINHVIDRPDSIDRSIDPAAAVVTLDHPTVSKSDEEKHVLDNSNDKSLIKLAPIDPSYLLSTDDSFDESD